MEGKLPSDSERMLSRLGLAVPEMATRSPIGGRGQWGRGQR